MPSSIISSLILDGLVGGLIFCILKLKISDQSPILVVFNPLTLQKYVLFLNISREISILVSFVIFYKLHF